MISKAFCLLLFQSLACHAWLQAYPWPIRHRPSLLPPRRASPLNQNPKWLDDAMGNKPEENNDNAKNARLSQVLPLAPGLAGFCVDPELGFVAIVTDPQSERCGAIVVSPADQERLQSAEALTMVQLAGGLDLATPILPPDLLEKLVRDEFEEDDEGSAKIGFCSLTQVTVQRVHLDAEETTTVDPSLMNPPLECSPAREQKIQESLPKVHAAIQKLPGLSNTQPDHVLEQLRCFSNEEGNLDRNGFSNLLAVLRKPNQALQSRQHQVSFDIHIQVISEDSVRQVVAKTRNPVWALGLVLRHRKSLIVEDRNADLLEWPCHQILEPFPNFRPVKELLQDAKAMDGFIPSMFQSLENDNNLGRDQP